MTPSVQLMQAYQQLYSYYNERLFGGQLKDAILNFSRKSGAMGFFSQDRWMDAAGMSKVHEISINPESHFDNDLELCQTLVHEMCHLWQQDHGTPPRKCYHDKQWAGKMEDIGLMPSDTHAPGGKKTGQRMGDYPIPGGRFMLVYEAMPPEILLPFKAIPQPPELNSAKQKTKYTCPKCSANVWGKENMRIDCGDCDIRFKAA